MTGTNKKCSVESLARECGCSANIAACMIANYLQMAIVGVMVVDSF